MGKYVRRGRVVACVMVLLMSTQVLGILSGTDGHDSGKNRRQKHGGHGDGVGAGGGGGVGSGGGIAYTVPKSMAVGGGKSKLPQFL
ncbi:hypothetical protein ARALYDRAFT_912033 [Arabidopsis lyrata subsp. lyrata]|uniref:Glycine-rich protein n=1 Tax=Arabidopsis lyrata subsp. lyrata TaxID=81972 RepID=D7M468_ARALL|nr:hypothetical protein ARALYDRAFT_912033 [Arabidopsis lyrata subsp. lyrata]